MTIQMNVAEAKAKLSELLEAAASGREVLIAKSGKVVARLVAVEEPQPRELGFFTDRRSGQLFRAAGFRRTRRLGVATAQSLLLDTHAFVWAASERSPN